MKLNAVFLGSKEFGLKLFKCLREADPGVKWTVLCPPDLNDTRTHLKEFQDYTKSKNIDCLIADDPSMVERYALDRKPDVIIVCGYYRILSKKLLKNVPLGIWGFHNSLLPKYRGGSPLVWQLINREKEVGSSFFKFTSGMDDGDILSQVKLENTANMTIGEASKRIEQAWMAKLPKLWASFCRGDIHPREQNHDEASYCAQRQEADGLINWQQSAEEIDAFIRAQDTPYPRAFFKLNKKIFKVVTHSIDSRKISGACGQVFQIINGNVVICCGGCTAIKISKILDQGNIVDASTILTSIKFRLS